ncbi:hypothetical protein ABTX85_20850 [Streptomyces sp. NPDC096097]|uniref:hypothetical protein n=1 Tax=Streptomyces sp. NPDC096097 TaxID=3155546 RepID=UPI0033201A33
MSAFEDGYVPLLSVAFLQLYNHRAEEATVRTYANETCRGCFFRRRGRAEYGRNRTTGIKFCTRECAHAQREHRRSRKAARPQASSQNDLDAVGTRDEKQPAT